MLPKQFCQERLQAVSPEALPALERDELQVLALYSYVVAADLTPAGFTSELAHLAETRETPRLARAARRVLEEWRGVAAARA